MGTTGSSLYPAAPCLPLTGATPYRPARRCRLRYPALSTPRQEKWILLESIHLHYCYMFLFGISQTELFTEKLKDLESGDEESFGDAM
uniref:Uncharacterized protein n=1 Tax=Oryza brachyantha TaxID=4533 RepID=J3MKH0_ORYBR